MNGLFEDYKYLYDMYLEQFDYPQMALQVFAENVGIPFGLACIIHFIMVTNTSYEHIWLLPHGAILQAETSPETSIAKGVDYDGEYVDYYNGVEDNVGYIEDDIENYVRASANLSEEVLTALKILVKALDLDIDIY